MSKNETSTSQNLVFQKLSLSDAPSVLKLWSDRDAVNLTNWPYLDTLSEVEERLGRAISFYNKERHFGAFSVFGSDRQFVGLIGAGAQSEELGEFEVWFFLDRQCRGQGVGKKVFNQFLHLLRQDKRVKILKATVLVKNAPSWKILEAHGFQRTGLRVGGHIKNGVTSDLFEYSLEMSVLSLAVHSRIGEALQFRKALIGDATSVAQIGAESFAQTFLVPDGDTLRNQLIEQYVREKFQDGVIRAEMQVPGSEFQVACLDGDPVGFAKVNRRPCPYEVNRELTEHEFQLERLYMGVTHLSLGYGQKFLEHLLTHIRVQGGTGVWLGVYEGNFKAMKFYERNGFGPIGKCLFKYTSGEDSIVDTDFIYHKRL